MRYVVPPRPSPLITFEAVGRIKKILMIRAPRRCTSINSYVGLRQFLYCLFNREYNLMYVVSIFSLKKCLEHNNNNVQLAKDFWHSQNPLPKLELWGGPFVILILVQILIAILERMTLRSSVSEPGLPLCTTYIFVFFCLGPSSGSWNCIT